MSNKSGSPGHDSGTGANSNLFCGVYCQQKSQHPAIIFIRRNVLRFFLQSFPSYRQKETVVTETDNLYCIFHFLNIAEIEKVISSLETRKKDDHLFSQWYRWIDDVNTISLDLPIEAVKMDSVRDHFHRKLSQDQKIPLQGLFNTKDIPLITIVLPCQVVKPNGVIAVRNELRFALLELKDALKDGLMNTHHLNNYGEREDGKSGDVETGEQRGYIRNDETDKEDPCIYLAVRFSSLGHGKLRRIGLCEILKTAVTTAKHINRNSEYSWLVLNQVDAHQSGIYTLAQDGTISNKKYFVKLRIKLSDLEEHITQLKRMDSVIIDILIFLKDSSQMRTYRSNMKLKKLPDTIDNLSYQESTRKARSSPANCLQVAIEMEGHNMNRTVRGVDPKVIEGQLKLTLETLPGNFYELSDAAKKSILKNLQISIGKARSIDPKFLKVAIETTVDLKENKFSDDAVKLTEKMLELVNKNGYSHEEPLKIITAYRCAFHLYRKSGYFTTYSRYYQPYLKNVKSLSPSGYRVKTCSYVMWITLSLGICIPFVYGFVRWKYTNVKGSSIEDVISTASNLLTVFIVISSPIVFQIFYHGEQLSDVLTNMRKIDTQDEFLVRKNQQSQDILQVLHLSRDVPSFLGGGDKSNISYIWSKKNDRVFDAKDPMSFPNLEVLGYELFEDELGRLFMFDPWDSFYEITVLRLIGTREDILNASTREEILDASHSEVVVVNESDERTRDNNYEQEVKRMPPLEMKLRCFSTKLRPDAAKSDVPPGEKPKPEPLNENTGSVLVSFKGFRGEETIHVSRVLPYGSRKRCVQNGNERSIKVHHSWMQINNSDLLRMDVGEFSRYSR